MTRAKPYTIKLWASFEFLSTVKLGSDDYLYPGQIILIPNKGVEIVITKENETLGNLLKKLDTNIEQLILQNPNIVLEKDQLITYKKSLKITISIWLKNNIIV